MKRRHILYTLLALLIGTGLTFLAIFLVKSSWPLACSDPNAVIADLSNDSSYVVINQSGNQPLHVYWDSLYKDLDAKDPNTGDVLESIYFYSGSDHGYLSGDSKGEPDTMDPNRYYVAKCGLNTFAFIDTWNYVVPVTPTPLPEGVLK